MGPNLKLGAIFLPLLLALSASGFILVKVLAKNQEEVVAATTDRLNTASFRYTLSQHMGEPKTWYTYKNSTYKYQIKHPQDWEREENISTGTNILSSYRTFLGTKVELNITVKSYYPIEGNIPIIKVADNKFYILKDDQQLKLALIQKDKHYYLIQLTQDSYFSDQTEFKGVFFQLLKLFQFTT